jgi:hypothetical protein
MMDETESDPSSSSASIGKSPAPTGADWTAGENLLKWIDAYSSCPGNARSCWLGRKKKLVCMSWREADTSDEDEEGDEDEDDEGEEEEEEYVDHSLD